MLERRQSAQPRQPAQGMPGAALRRRCIGIQTLRFGRIFFAGRGGQNKLRRDDRESFFFNTRPRGFVRERGA